MIYKQVQQVRNIIEIVLQKILIRSMKSNFHSNQILYVRGIGYARLAIDKKNDIKTTDASKTGENVTETEIVTGSNEQLTDSVIFCPQMFKIDSDSPFAESQVEVNLSELNTRKKSMQMLRRHSSDMKSRQQIIVPLKLQQCNVMIYCPEPYLMKKITINVKSLLQNCRKSISISIDITKTIDNLRIQIFKQLGQDIGYYSDIKMITMSPRMEELNVGSKTVWQYQLKDKCRVTLMAKHNFAFSPLPQGKEEFFTLSNNNNTIANAQKKPQTITASTETNPPIQPVTTVVEPKVQNNEQQPLNEAQNVNTTTKQEQKPQYVQQQQKLPPQVLKPQEIQKLHLQSNIKLNSGIHYWEVKIDKLNPNKQKNSLLIGIQLKNYTSTQKTDSTHLWAYDPIRCKKVEHANQKKLYSQEKQQKELNASDQSDQEYGSFAKNGDVIGVLLIVKEKRVSLIFYKNSTCLQECYEFNLQSYKEQNPKNNFYLSPFISLSGQIQLTLDSKASPPLDSYRFK